MRSMYPPHGPSTQALMTGKKNKTKMSRDVLGEIGVTEIEAAQGSIFISCQTRALQLLLFQSRTVENTRDGGQNEQNRRRTLNTEICRNGQTKLGDKARGLVESPADGGPRQRTKAEEVKDHGCQWLTEPPRIAFCEASVPPAMRARNTESERGQVPGSVYHWVPPSPGIPLLTLHQGKGGAVAITHGGDSWWPTELLEC